MTKAIVTEIGEHLLIERVGRFMEPLCDYVKEPEKTFDEWLSHVFTEFFYRQTGAAFAPFNDRFEGRRDFPEAFSRFVDDEVRGQRVGKFSALSRVISALASRLSESLRDVGPFDAEPSETEPRNYVADFPFLLFQALRLVDMEEACKWAANAVRSSGGLADRWTLSELPFPIALYYEMRGRDTSGPNRRDFNDAMLEWCVNNTGLNSIGLPSFSILLDVLRGRNASARVDLINSRLSLIETIDKEICELDYLKGNGSGLASRGKKLRDAFGLDGATTITALDTLAKTRWRQWALLFEAFPEELCERSWVDELEPFNFDAILHDIHSGYLMYRHANAA